MVINVTTGEVYIVNVTIACDVNSGMHMCTPHTQVMDTAMLFAVFIPS